MSIRAIIFDWAGVFCSPGEPFAHPNLQEQTGLTLDQIGQKTKDIQAAYYLGQTSTAEFWTKVAKRLNLGQLSPVELSRAYLSSYRLYPEMLRLAADLRPRYQTAILSNLTRLMMDHIVAEHQIKDFFDMVFFSNEIGYAKPDPLSYRFALTKLKAKPEQTIFIDDSKTNLVAAAQLGLQTILFESPEQCHQALAVFGVITKPV